MKNNINLISKAIYNDNITKKQAEKEKLYNAKLLLWLELYLKQEFKSYFDKYDLNNAETNIIKDKINIKIKVYDKILHYYETTEKTKLNDKQETETTEQYIYFFEDLDFLSFTLIFNNNFYGILDNFKKDYKFLDKKAIDNLQNDLYNWFIKQFKIYKNKGYYIKQQLNTLEERQATFNEVKKDYNVNFKDYNKIYTNLLNEVAKMFDTSKPKIKKNNIDSLFTILMVNRWVNGWKKPK